MTVRTSRTDLDLDPVAVGARTGTLWRGSALSLAGVGELQAVPADHDRLAASAGADELACPGSGPVAFAALPFAPDEPRELLVPEIVYGRCADGRRWITVADDRVSPAEAEARLLEESERALPTRRPTQLSVSSPLSGEHWRDEIVAPVVERIRAGEVTKVVLARELLLHADHELDPGVLVARLAARFPAVLLFAVDGFVGASPELLLSRLDDVVRAHPLAGTAPRSSDPAEDQRLASRLLGSTKDRWEHRVTIDWFLDNLLPFCSYVDAEPEPSLVTLANVHHLGTRVEGRLSAPAASALELVDRLHPTPALGGDPQAEAVRIIAEVEGFDRGRYGGPVGWVDAAGNGELAVGIRSAQLRGDLARVWAGVGVVADSDPEAELAETRAKFQAVLGSIVEL